jgi:hypothetical protein
VSLVLYLALALLAFSATWAHPNAATVGAAGDRGLFMWFLKWMEFALRHGHNPLVTHYMNYPQPVNLMWNTSEPLPGLVLAPLTAMAGAAVTFNVLATLGVALSAFTAFVAIGRVVKHRAAAWVGGLLYGFSPFMLNQSNGHLHLTLAFLPPLIFVVLHEIMVRQQVRASRAGALLGLLIACQLLIGEELLAITAIAAVTGIVVLALARPRLIASKLAYPMRAAPAAAAVFAAIAGWPLAVQFFGPNRVSGPIQPLEPFVSDLAGFVVPTKLRLFTTHAALAISHRFTGNATEHDAYIGIPLLIVLGYAAIKHRKNPVVRFASAMAVILAVLSMGRHVHVAGHVTHILLPWRVLSALPVLNNVLPARLMVMFSLAAAVLVAVLVDEALRSKRRPAIAATLAALGLVVASLLPVLPFPSAALPGSTFFSTADARTIPAGSVALVVPMSRGPLSARGPMLWQIDSGFRFRMPGGFFVGSTPDESSGRVRGSLASFTNRIQTTGVVPRVDETQRSKYLSVLRSWHVQTVVIGPTTAQQQLAAFFTQILGRPPVAIDDAYVWHL